MRRASPLLKLQEPAQDQWGLVTRRQAQAAGIGQSTLDRLTAEGGSLERVTRGVYQLAGAPIADHRDLRAAWLQLAPDRPAWERTPDQGVVSHRSAASLCGLGHLPADRHEFTVPRRRQTRRADVRIHVRPLHDGEWIEVGGLPVTRPARIASDLIRDHEDPEAIAQLIADAVRAGLERPEAFAGSLARHARSFGLRAGDGVALLSRLLGMTGDRERSRWIDRARGHIDHAAGGTAARPGR